MSVPVLEVEPSRNADVDARYQRQAVRLDSGSGPLDQVDRAGVPVPQWEPFTWILDGRAEVSQFLAWLDERAGALSPVFVPTWQRDLVLAEDAGPTDSEIVIQSCGYTEFMFADNARTWLAFLFPDGSKFYRQIIDAEVDGATEILTLNSPLGVDLTADVMISFLRLVRLSTDEVEILWHTGEIAEVQLQFTELPRLTEFPDVPIDLRYRPTAHTFNPEPDELIRGTWTNPSFARDTNPDTACIVSLNGTSPGSEFSMLHLHTFQPFSTAGVVSLDVVATMEYRAHGNASSGLRLDIGLFDGIDDNKVHPPVAAISEVVSYDANDIAKTDYSVNVPIATWNGIADPTVRIVPWNTLAASYSPDVQMLTYRCYVRLRFT